MSFTILAASRCFGRLWAGFLDLCGLLPGNFASEISFIRAHESEKRSDRKIERERVKSDMPAIHGAPREEKPGPFGERALFSNLRTILGGYALDVFAGFCRNFDLVTFTNEGRHLDFDSSFDRRWLRDVRGRITASGRFGISDFQHDMSGRTHVDRIAIVEKEVDFIPFLEEPHPLFDAFDREGVLLESGVVHEDVASRISIGVLTLDLLDIGRLQRIAAAVVPLDDCAFEQIFELGFVDRLPLAGFDEIALEDLPRIAFDLDFQTLFEFADVDRGHTNAVLNPEDEG